MIVQLLTSFTGALGFCLVFHLRRRYMFAASLGGLLTCGVYLAAASIWSGILLPTLTAAAFAALYAEFLAWFMGAPATLFLIPALLIPLVPGRPLYYAMYYAVQQDMDLSADFARQTALYALGIALGASPPEIGEPTMVSRTALVMARPGISSMMSPIRILSAWSSGRKKAHRVMLMPTARAESRLNTKRLGH